MRREFMRLLFTALIMVLVGVPMANSAEEPIRIDLQMDNVFFKSGTNMVHAFVYKPQGRGPFPAIIYNQPTRDPYFLPGGVYPFESIAKWTTRHQWVLFIPDRVPHEISGKKLGDFAGLLDDTSNLVQTNRLLLEGFSHVGRDIENAARWLTNQAYVDANKLAMMGHSTGAIQSLLQASKASSVRGYVVFSPAPKWWNGNDMIRSLLTTAAQRARDPIFVIQTQNEASLGPSHDIGIELKNRPAPAGVKVYPPYGSNSAQAMMFAVQAVDVWSDDVAQFLTAIWK